MLSVQVNRIDLKSKHHFFGILLCVCVPFRAGENQTDTTKLLTKLCASRFIASEKKNKAIAIKYTCKRFVSDIEKSSSTHTQTERKRTVKPDARI